MQGSVIVRIIVTGITAIVPSAQDEDVTRLIAPKHMEMTEHHPMIPEHFAFIEVHSKNLVPGGRPEDFRYHHPADADDDHRVVFIVRSEEIKFGNTPANRTLVRNAAVPENGLAQAEGDEELTSTAYVLEMAQLCPSCKSIDNAYFDVLAHPDKVALRMDLVGGRKSVLPPRLEEVWHAEGSTIKQPLAQEVVYEFDVPACGQRLILSRVESPGAKPTEETIALHAPDGKPIDVLLGNAPLLSILRLDADFKGEHRDDHFALFYDMFTPAPAKRPVLKVLQGPGIAEPTAGPKDNCIPPELRPQDPL